MVRWPRRVRKHELSRMQPIRPPDLLALIHKGDGRYTYLRWRRKP